MQPKSSMKMMLPRSIRSRPTAPRHRTLPTPLVRQIGNRQPSLDFQLPLQYTRLPRTFCQRPTIAFFVFCFPSLSARHVVPRTTRPIPALSPTQTRPLSPRPLLFQPAVPLQPPSPAPTAHLHTQWRSRPPARQTSTSAQARDSILPRPRR